MIEEPRPTSSCTQRLKVYEEPRPTSSCIVPDGVPGGLDSRGKIVPAPPELRTGRSRRCPRMHTANTCKHPGRVAP